MVTRLIREASSKAGSECKTEKTPPLTIVGDPDTKRIKLVSEDIDGFNMDRFMEGTLFDHLSPCQIEIFREAVNCALERRPCYYDLIVTTHNEGDCKYLNHIKRKESGLVIVASKLSGIEELSTAEKTAVVRDLHIRHHHTLSEIH